LGNVREKRRRLGLGTFSRDDVQPASHLALDQRDSRSASDRFRNIELDLSELWQGTQLSHIEIHRSAAAVSQTSNSCNRSL
jgi:hypothetical protein